VVISGNITKDGGCLILASQISSIFFQYHLSGILSNHRAAPISVPVALSKTPAYTHWLLHKPTPIQWFSKMSTHDEENVH